MEELIRYIENNVYTVKTSKDLFNQYNQVNLNYDLEDAHQIRRTNLNSYIKQLILPIEVMFIEMAPGAKGCRFSGIPFTNERVLLARNGNFFKNGLYSKSNKAKSFTESSSSRLWKSFNDYISPKMFNHIFMWNLVPFHPEGKTPLDNRDPSHEELRKYTPIALDIISIIQPKKICCFGSYSHNTLSTLLDIDILYIPHPLRATYETLRLIYDDCFDNLPKY